MRTQVRVVSVEVVPIQGAEIALEASGAYASIYVLAPNDDAAIDLAAREMTHAGWSPVAIPDVRTVNTESFTDDNDALKYFEQCLIDGVVVVLHTWRDMH
ncbi:hypothetical protein RQP54_03940 [Curvibacter sp. APW13]|uniref:hypothetical protein n=1 Tax=Curvibacter sp. APW13 TaxID=3077236 RepID=UPI0028DDB4F8|nr:hypothetical protein [Curvibacter sp. APW13]MDT8990004.1 hypothetical protein [Curvibacter sp. APW13]